MTNTFVPHPSVRIKGTETNYLPLQCFNPLCVYKIPHMHCPFCVKSESYSDPVILKAHFRVKHVDKGIEFAGLKILRCCDQCDIVGVIKGEKKFKGAHWHCYRCKNGFNRRDEAIKHYKTHFRNPQTTFQIQIAQDINQPVVQGYETEDATCSIPTDGFSVHSVPDNNTSYSQPGSVSMMQRGLDGMVNMPGVGAIETVGLSDTQTIMIIQDDNALLPQDTSQDITQTDNSNEMLAVAPQTTAALTERIRALQDRVTELEEENEDKDTQIQALNKKVVEQDMKLALYKEQVEELNNKRVGELPRDNKSIDDLCCVLESQHRELIQQQLKQIQDAVNLANVSKSPQSTTRMIIISAANADLLNSQQNTSTTSLGDSVNITSYSEHGDGSQPEHMQLQLQCNDTSQLKQSVDQGTIEIRTDGIDAVSNAELLNEVKDSPYEEMLEQSFDETLGEGDRLVDEHSNQHVDVKQEYESENKKRKLSC